MSHIAKNPATMHYQVFFTNVLRLLDESKMTKSELAERADISVSFLSDITNGKANPSINIMDAIAKALNTSLPTLLEMTDLDEQTFDSLAADDKMVGLPDGHVHVFAVLTEFQAFVVKRWDKENRKKLAKKRPSK